MHHVTTRGLTGSAITGDKKICNFILATCDATIDSSYNKRLVSLQKKQTKKHIFFYWFIFSHSQGLLASLSGHAQALIVTDDPATGSIRQKRDKHKRASNSLLEQTNRALT